MIMTTGWRIEGDIHVLADSRLTDSLNSRTKGFFAVTDAIISDAQSGTELHRPSYVAINREAISVIFPLEE